MGKRIRDVIQAPDRAVLLLVDGDNGELLRLTPASDAATARRFSLSLCARARAPGLRQ
jgi:hypothetical protein